MNNDNKTTPAGEAEKPQDQQPNQGRSGHGIDSILPHLQQQTQAQIPVLDTHDDTKPAGL